MNFSMKQYGLTDRFLALASINDDKGRHTTTHRELILLSEGGMVIDTPGMRELGMWDNLSGIAQIFEDIENLVIYCGSPCSIFYVYDSFLCEWY